MKIKIATSQFALSADIQKNKATILTQIQQAVDEGADVIHFPEGSLSGYAGIDFPSFEGFDWKELESATLEVMDEAARGKIWVILGSSHRLEKHKPHNSLYIINSEGQIVDRYDKMFCAGNDKEETEDLLHFSPGNHFCTFEISGVKCGVLICHEFRYPELYREYKKLGVEVMFHSYHAGNMDTQRQALMEAEVGEEYVHLNPGRTLPEITMPATMISYAANNYLWISCSNTSAAESCWASMMLRPDGVTIGRMEKNSPGILLNEIDSEKEFYDSTKYWRNRAMSGIYHSGRLVEDKRSKKRTEI